MSTSDRPSWYSKLRLVTSRSTPPHSAPPTPAMADEAAKRSSLTRFRLPPRVAHAAEESLVAISRRPMDPRRTASSPTAKTAKTAHSKNSSALAPARDTKPRWTLGTVRSVAPMTDVWEKKRKYASSAKASVDSARYRPRRRRVGRATIAPRSADRAATPRRPRMLPPGDSAPNSQAPKPMKAYWARDIWPP